MVMIEQCTAPSYERLRPMRPPREAGFPVYPDLVEHLLAPCPEVVDPVVAHALGVCSGYSYAGADVLTIMLARLGMPDNRCRSVTMLVDPMFIRSTANVVQSADGRVVVVCYRGTEPMSLVNWLTDADVYPEKVRFAFPGSDEGFDVHAGFYRNVRATRFEVLRMLERALRGESVLDDGGAVPQPMQALYLTGHSLGGAMATLLGIMLVTDPAFAALADRLRAVCTFGQPMVGSPELAAACRQHELLGHRVVRYVYQHDVVPHLPPQDSGDFAHVGLERHFDGSAWRSVEPTHQMGNLVGLLEMPLAYLGRRLEHLRRVPFRYSLDDHLPHHYIAALTPPGVPSEFGDAPYADDRTR
jgi:hypothetical protein